MTPAVRHGEPGSEELPTTLDDTMRDWPYAGVACCALCGSGLRGYFITGYFTTGHFTTLDDAFTSYSAVPYQIYSATLYCGL